MSSDTSFAAASQKSTSTFLSALIVASAAAAAQIILFVFLRPSIKKVYVPRTYLPVPARRTPIPNWAPWGWILPPFLVSSKDIIPTAGLDAYTYLRFCKMMIYIFLPLVLVTWPILMTVNALGTTSSDGLNRFTFNSIQHKHQGRYWAHIVCAYVLTFWVFFLIQREMSNFVAVRGAWLVSTGHLALPRARTVLVTGVPKGFLSRESILRVTQKLPGGVKRLWISRALGTLPQLYNARLSACSNLESAETVLCTTALKRHQEEEKEEAKAHLKGRRASIRQASSSLLEGQGTLADQLVPRKLRPTHRLGFLGLWGKKVDTIDHSKDEIVRLTAELKEERLKIGEHPPQNSVFIEFNDQLAAHIFAQSVIHHAPLRMANRYVDVAPEDVIWDNLNINPYDARIRHLVAWGITIGLIVVWSFPVAFVGVVSHLSSLCSNVSWLAWLCRAPGRIDDIIQGILPPVLLLLLFFVLPHILRVVGRYSGIPTRSEIELSLMSRYFLFLIIHGFLVTTLTSGLTAAIPEIIANPSQTVQFLGNNLPKASTFFMTYVVTTSLTGASAALLQVVQLILYYLKLFVFASTPRSVFKIQYNMNVPEWGTLFPNSSLITVIGLAYAIIAPIMSGICLLAFSFFWFTYKYLFMYTLDVPEAYETGGRFFPMAMKHVFVGLYLCQLCMMCLFFLLVSSTDSDRTTSLSQAILMIVLLVITVFYQNLITSSYFPLTQYLPFTLQDRVETEYGKEGAPVNEAHGEFKTEQRNIGRGDFDSSTPAAVARPHRSREASDAKQPSRRESKSELKRRLTAGGGHDRGGNETSEWALHVEDKKAELGRNAFLHPSIWESTRPLWLPNDVLGLGHAEASDMKLRKIPASTAGAALSAKGYVIVTRSPPENIDVIELEHGSDKEGFLSLSNAIGAGMVRVVERLDNQLDELVRRTGPELFKRNPSIDGGGPSRSSLSLKRSNSAGQSGTKRTNELKRSRTNPSSSTMKRASLRSPRLFGRFAMEKLVGRSSSEDHGHSIEPTTEEEDEKVTNANEMVQVLEGDEVDVEIEIEKEKEKEKENDNENEKEKETVKEKEEGSTHSNSSGVKETRMSDEVVGVAPGEHLPSPT